MPEPAPLTVQELLRVPKKIGRALRSSGADPEHQRLDIRLEADTPGEFRVFVRVLRALPENFSFGLRFLAPDGNETVLLRVNGDAHRHQNPDRSYFSQGPHIHGFRGQSLLTPPRPGALPKWAWPLDANHIVLGHAWALFCAATSLTSTARIERRIKKLRGQPVQLSLLPET